MSGLEPLAALGLACNILQLIEVGGTTIKLAKNVYQSSSPYIDQALQDNAAVLSTISSEVKAAKRPASLSKLDQQLVTTADKCSTAARDLEEEVQFLLGNAKQKQLAATLKIVAKTTWRKRRLDRLKESLENAEKLMTKTILAQIWSRTRAAELDMSNVKDDLRAFIQQYSSGTKDIKQLVSSENSRTRKHISAASKETLEAIGGVHTQMTRLALEADVQVNQALRDRLLQSLKFPGFNERRNQVHEAHTSTFEWIFIGDNSISRENVPESELEDSDWEDSDLKDIDLADPSEVSWDLYSNWLSSTSNLYWISGKPGSGKTTLVKYLLNHSKTAAYLDVWSPQPLIISHFLWRPGTPIQHNINGMLCSLLYQLLENSTNAIEHILRNTQARRSGMKDCYTDWSVPELRAVLLQTLHSYDRPICIFIDGLDEVHPAEGPLELLNLVEELLRCRNTKLCLSSRPEPILEDRLSPCPHLRLHNLTRRDLEQYARDHVKSTRSIHNVTHFGKAEPDESLVWLLVNKAEGVFLWLVLAIKSVNMGFSYGDTGSTIRQRIDHLPGDLTKLYKDMWGRACADNPPVYCQMAALCFKLILLSQHDSRRLMSNSFDSETLLHLMLASTPIADQLLDAVDSPTDLVPEEDLLKCCRAFARRLKIYCFGLVETYQLSVEDGVVGWYGCQYDTLWRLYGRRHIRFVHRTAQDFLLDTVDGQDILRLDATSENLILFKWTRAHLAISQLFAGTGARYNSCGTATLADKYVELLETLPGGAVRSGDLERARTISYLKAMCSSGQLLHGLLNGARLCGGIDFLNISGSIYDEELFSRSKLSTLSMAKKTEILLNVCNEFYPGHGPPVPKTSTEPLIMTLLSEGADPNRRGSNYTPWNCKAPGFSQLRTPFIQYLESILCKLAWLRIPAWNAASIGPDSIVAVMKNLHEFLSHSANLDDKIYLVGSCYTSPSFHIDYNYFGIRRTLEDCNGQLRDPPSCSLIFQIPAHIVLNALLDHLGTEIGRMRHENEALYAELLSLLVRVREYLDNWPTEEHGRVIGRLTFKRFEHSEDNHGNPKRLWHTPSEGYTLSDELMGSLEKGLLNDFTFTPSAVPQGGSFERLIEQAPWTMQASGFQETCESLTELGILARADYEVHDVQGWVDRFQRRLFADARVIDEHSAVSDS